MKMTQAEKERFVDLHIHSMYSDGVFTPEKIIETAVEKGLKAIALTDHDSVEGVQRAIEAAKGKAIEVIPGVEMSATISGEDIHILGYFVDWKDPVLLKELAQIREDRKVRMREMLSLLREQGIDLDEQMVFDTISKSSAGRLHLAKILLKEKAVSTLQNAFDKYIGNGKPCFVGYKHLNYANAIKTIKRAGGVAVLAHPGTMGNDKYIPDYVKAGLSGLEVYYNKHRPDIMRKYSALADKHGLIATGGSDCHGSINGKGIIMMGSVKVKYEAVEKLRNAAGKLRT